MSRLVLLSLVCTDVAFLHVVMRCKIKTICLTCSFCLSLGIVSYMDNACLKFELMGCEEPKVEPLLGYDYGYSPCVGEFLKMIIEVNNC